MQTIQADIIPVVRHLVHDLTQLPGRTPATVQTNLPELTMDFDPFDLQNLFATLVAAAMESTYDQNLSFELLQEDPSHLTILMTVEVMESKNLKAAQALTSKFQAEMSPRSPELIEVVLPIFNQAIFWSPQQVLQLYIKN